MTSIETVSAAELVADGLAGDRETQIHPLKKMNNESNISPLHQLVLVAFFCALASVGIVALAFCLLSNISGNGMWAIAAMAAAPSLMGTGIAYFMTRHVRQDAPKP